MPVEGWAKRCPNWCAFGDHEHFGPCVMKVQIKPEDRRKWVEYRKHLVDPDEYAEDQRDRDEDADARNR